MLSALFEPFLQGKGALETPTTQDCLINVLWSTAPVRPG